MGLFVGVGGWIMYEWIAVDVLIADYSIQPLHAMVVTLVGVVIAALASETRNWQQYHIGERLIVLVGLVLMLAQQLSIRVQEFILGEVALQILVWFITMAMWLVVSR